VGAGFSDRSLEDLRASPPPQPPSDWAWRHLARGAVPGTGDRGREAQLLVVETFLDAVI